MKYVLMYTSRPDLDAETDPETAKAIYDASTSGSARTPACWPTPAPSCSAWRRPRPCRTAPAGSVVVDGPFNEAKEVIGGFSVIEVADMDAAIAVVKTWPLLELPGVAVEIRPMVEDYSHMEG